MNGGKLIGIRPKDIAGLMYNEGGAPKGSVGDIRIFLKHSLIEVSPEIAPQVIEKLSTCSICGYEVNVREDKGKPEGDNRPAVHVRDRRSNGGESYPGRENFRREKGNRFERAERFNNRKGDRFERSDRRENKGDRYERRDRRDRDEERTPFFSRFSKKPRR